jgi:vacuolar protein sorting-associated protein 13A/C
MEQFATLKLSSADVALLLRAGTMRLTTTLGNLTFVDDTPTVTADPSFKQLLSIEGDELADFSYETFNPDDDATFPGYNSAIKLRTGSLRFTLMEEPLNHLMQFLANLSRLKAFYDRASEAAMQKASEVTKMHYDLIIKTPIVVLPQNGLLSTERVVLRLGQVNAKNHFKHDSKSPDTIKATLSGVNMTTESSSSTLQILDNVDLALEVEEYEASAERPRAQKVGQQAYLGRSLPNSIHFIVCADTRACKRYSHDTDTETVHSHHGLG